MIQYIKRFIWYKRRLKFLENYRDELNLTLIYFDSVKTYNPYRDNIGEDDLSIMRPPKANPKKTAKYNVGCSTSNITYILDELPKEFAILERFNRIMIKS